MFPESLDEFELIVETASGNGRLAMLMMMMNG